MTLDTPTSRRLFAATYRHVTFADVGCQRRRPVNFGPVPEQVHIQPGTLSIQEHSFVRWLFERSGLSLSDYRLETITRRLAACLRLVRACDVNEARYMLESDPSLEKRAIGALIIGVTSFFRDSGVFDLLRDTLLPVLLEIGRPPRIWSVGCSDGRELYSVMMLMSELGELDRAEWLGTDCRIEATRSAAAGEYADVDVRTLPALLQERYFLRTTHGWRVSETLRRVARWRTADALKLTEPGLWDLILCRNMAMYLEARSGIQLWETLHAALRPGGILIVGKAERPNCDGLVPIAPCVFRRNRG